MDEETIHVACLCAAWCRLCDDYAPVLTQVTDEFAVAHARFHRHWIDIEDEAELLGDLDVETFPTLVVVGPEGVRFAGPITPQADTLRRLLRATATDARPDAGRLIFPPEVHAFGARLRHRVPPR